jgi:hypothetical protein
VLTATGLCALLVVGCTGADGSSEPADLVTVDPGAPPDVFTPTDLAVASGDDPRELLVVTLGSSSCPTVPVEAAWDFDEDVLRVVLGTSGEADEPCSADSAQSTSVLRVPSEAPDVTEGLTVVVDDQELTVSTP